MSQTESLCLSIMKSISVWKLNTPTSVSMHRSQRIWWLKNFLSFWNDKLATAILRIRPGKSINVRILKMQTFISSKVKREKNAVKSNLYSGWVLIDAEIGAATSTFKKCHCRREPFGWRCLACIKSWWRFSCSASERIRAALASTLVWWLLLSNTTCSSSGQPETKGSWAAATSAAISKYLPVKPPSHWQPTWRMNHNVS